MNPSVCMLVLLAVGPALPASIPSDVKGCKRDDPKLSECAVKAANYIFPSLVDGNAEFSIPVLDPFEIKNVVLSERNGQGLDLALHFDDLKVRGLKDAILNEASKINFKNQSVDLQASLPSLTLEGKYVVDGKVLLLPIKGSGDANITLGGLKVTYDADFTFHKNKDGKEFAQLANSRVYFTADRFNIYLDNLFNGDKNLGNHMNTFLNENGQEVLKEFGPVLRETIKTIIFTLVNNIAHKVSPDVIFPK